MQLRNIEIFADPEGCLIVKCEGLEQFSFEEKHTDFTQAMVERIKSNYPKVYEALLLWYEKRRTNERYFLYSMASRFCRCNFQHLDEIKNIDEKGFFHFEYSRCPMTGEFKFWNIVCRPKFKSILSDRNYDVMKLINCNMTVEAIADKLQIAIEIVKKHRENSLQALGLHSTSEFIHTMRQ